MDHSPLVDMNPIDLRDSQDGENTSNTNVNQSVLIPKKSTDERLDDIVNITVVNPYKRKQKTKQPSLID